MQPASSTGPGPTVSTFHAWGHSILREREGTFGRSGEFILMEPEDRQRILEKCTGCSRAESSEMSEAVSRAKQELTPLEGDPRFLDTTIWRAYEDFCRTHDIFDLDDCIYRPALLFSQNPELSRDYHRRFPWVLIDEYQDVDLCQYRMIRQFIPGAEDNLFVIGDPDQAIYGFRGADVRFIREFLKDYPGAALYRLTRSYRCTQTILKASSRVLERSDKVAGLLQGIQEGVRISLSPQPTDASEAEFVARTIEALMGGLRFFSLDSDLSDGEGHSEIGSLSDFAVLCRIREQMRALERAFRNHGIPHQSIGETPFFRREPAKTVIDAYKAAVNPRNAYMRQRLSSAGIFRARDLDPLPGLIQDASVRKALASLIETYFRNKETADTDAFSRLLDLAEDFDSDRQGFLDFVSLGTGPDTYRRSLESVTLMTLHAAKGLEFPCVFIVGCEDGLLPYSLFGRKSDPEEERRLLYVGMTRAQKFLFLSYAAKRVVLGREHRLARCPYLDRIEDELLQRTTSSAKPRDKDVQMKLF
jgi:superfamily I DNA/RNA helicase